MGSGEEACTITFIINIIIITIIINIIITKMKTIFSNARDLIDRYLVEVKREREEFSKEQLVIAIIDLFAAGRFFNIHIIIMIIL